MYSISANQALLKNNRDSDRHKADGELVLPEDLLLLLVLVLVLVLVLFTPKVFPVQRVANRVGGFESCGFAAALQTVL